MKKEKAKPVITDSEQQNRPDYSLSKSKKILFRIILVLLPFIILSFIETGLQIFNYGGNLDLFVLERRGEVTEYVLNKDFTKRYFFQKGLQTPIPLSQTFSVRKDSNTYRIFCLGESSVQGFPYPPNGAFPAMLKYILSTLHPEKNIEVVNCGITAITSYSVFDMCEEILEKYKPNLLVVYTGHNEFYGVFGSASRLSLFENRTLQRLFLKLQNSKLFLLTRDVVNLMFGDDINHDPSLHRGTMMGIVAKDIGIKLNDEVFKRAENSFRENLEEIVNNAKENNTDILICNLIANQKDFPPFASIHSDSFSKKDSILWNELISKANSYQNGKQYLDAINFYLQALKIDSLYADIHFRLGQCFYEIKNYKLAKMHFTLAGDLDIVRFRAPSSFNKIIKKVCAENRVPLVNVNSDFERLSSNGIIGNDFIHEHVHPNQTGYLQIAKSISKVMSENGLINKSWDWTKEISDSEYYAMSHLTPLDKDVVNHMLASLTSHWPFNDDQRINYTRAGNEDTEKLAAEFILDGKKSLVELHLEYGSKLQKENKFDEALAEYKAAFAIQPVSQVYNRIGSLYLVKTEIAFKRLKDFNAARENFINASSFFLEGLKRWPKDRELNLNLGILYFMRNDKLKEAEERFLKVLEMDQKHQTSLKLLSELYLRLNQPEDAKSILKKAIEYYPGQAGFYTDLGFVLINEQQFENAKYYLEKAVKISNDQKAKYLLQKIETM